MDHRPDRPNAPRRLLRMLVEARWFFSFSASLCATIVGISLTFGINSCRENQRVRSEMRKSIVQAIDNIGERYAGAERWLDKLQQQNRIFETADSIYYATESLPDSVCAEVNTNLPYVRLTAFDHEFEKVFRGSYQLWQLQASNDSLTYYIGLCYDGLNTVEASLQEATDGMLEQFSAYTAAHSGEHLSPAEWTAGLISDPSFQFFMAIRGTKTEIAASLLREVHTIYQTHLLPASSILRP